MMKDRVFSKPRVGFGFNTDILEEILQEYLDPNVKMTEVTHPKYVPFGPKCVFMWYYHTFTAIGS